MGDALAEFRGVSEALQQLVALNRAGSTRASQEGDALYAQVRLQTLLAIALMVGVGLFIAVSVTRSVRRQLGGEPADTTETVRRIAGGDLTRPIALEPGDSTSLLAAMKDMQDKLTGMVREIQQSGEAVATASAQIAQGNHDLSSRAGDQGRGFAVVAGEVRALAQRSAEAAKEIKSLIGASVERVEQGTVQVVRAGSTMNEVVQAIRRVTDIMGEIDSASREQATGVAQVGEAVSQMDQATQQNAALVEESAAAADSLKQQAQALVRSAGAFRVDGAPPRAMPGAQAAAAIGRASARSRSAARPLTVAEDGRSGTLRASQPVADRAGPSDWWGF